LSNH